MKVLFNSRKIEYKNPFGCIVQGQPCTIHLYVSKDVKAQNVFISTDEDEIPMCDYKMEWQSENEEYNIYSTTFSLGRCGLYFYFFKIFTHSDEIRIFNTDNEATIGSGCRWQLSCYSDMLKISEEFQGKVMYQIFPDRFYKVGECDTTEKMTPFSIHRRTHDTPLYLPDFNGVVQNNDFYGGNLQGIKSKLSYLKELKVSLIYLNPIFLAYSNHRYDTGDYKKIDPLLGTEQDFKDLCDAAHRLKMKIILDGVFSHTGSKSTYFDIDNNYGGGAYHDPNSQYRSWFQFKTYPNDYESWWGITTLPCTKELDPNFLDYIIEGEDSVIAHWMELGADGFRLDVADELPDEFIEKLHRRVHEINPNSIVIGEVWEDASNKMSYGYRRKYFTKLELDSVMNYPFKDAIIAFSKGKLQAKDFVNVIMSIAENYPEPILHSLMNSLSTHDTVRIINSLAVPDQRLTKPQRALYWMEQHEMMRGIIMERAAVFLQFILPGCPCIYYGDEIGMQGFEDPFNRKYFQWEDRNEELLSFYKKMAKLKKSNVQLRLGSVDAEALSEKVISVTRILEGIELTAIVSSEESFTMDITGYHIVMITRAEQIKTKLVFKKYGFALLEKTKKVVDNDVNAQEE